MGPGSTNCLQFLVSLKVDRIVAVCLPLLSWLVFPVEEHVCGSNLIR